MEWKNYLHHLEDAGEKRQDKPLQLQTDLLICKELDLPINSFIHHTWQIMIVMQALVCEVVYKI